MSPFAPLVFAVVATAAPPSSSLSGAEGTLSWTVQSNADGVRIAGSSPKWSVTHTADADFTPRASTREAGGERWTVAYDATGATITNPDGSTTRVKQADLWDGDTVDVRLGAHVAAGGRSSKFTVLDAAGGKAWTVNATVSEGSCAVPCSHVKVQLAGAWKYVGPTWLYWYDADGRLLTFEGPIGRFDTEGGAS